MSSSKRDELNEMSVEYLRDWARRLYETRHLERQSKMLGQPDPRAGKQELIDYILPLIS